MNPYRTYFLACEENVVYGETVGVSMIAWNQNQEKWQHALEACATLEEDGFVTISISRELAKELAYNWMPIDEIEPDPMRELFDACRVELEGGA